MPLSSGSRLGPYEVLSAIGAGGMGEVYRARDTKLNREVAIKVLPERFADDSDRLARFKREAQVLASLNHPNIGHIYGLEESDGTRALVLELVEGPTLADRIAEGPLPPDEALPVARQIAEALEAAHEQGIIHRDLKPANIKLRADGTVKVLDFGLAKLTESPPLSTSTPALSQSPTITTPAMMTGVGMILGTAAYMSPEQAKGRSADKRSDIWAFGCVLYEMLTGKRAFNGEDVSDTLAVVLRGEPNWAALPAAIDVPIRTLIEKCLEKDARRRIPDVSTLVFLLENHATFSRTAVGSPRPIGARFAILFALAAVLMGALGLVAGLSMRPSSIPTRPIVTRFSFTLSEGQQFTENGNRIIAVSPGGTHLAYVANRRLYLRSISDLDARPIAGTEISEGLISGPVFAPDGQSIAYWTGDATAGVLKKVSVTGGPAMTLCQIGFPSGITWGTDGILIGQPARGRSGAAGQLGNTILRVAANGGPPEVLVRVKEGNLWGPQMLPGGDAILFSVAKLNAAFSSDGANNSHLVVHSLRSGEDKTILEDGTDPQYVATGHIVYLSGSTLFAVRFDLERLETIGRAVPVIENVRGRMAPGLAVGGAYASISTTGTLVYVSGSPPFVNSDIALIERSGKATPLNLRPAQYLYPRISPDGKRLAIEKDENGEANIWIHDLTRAASIRQLTLGGKRNRFPVWSPDGQRIAFQSDREGDAGIFRQRTDGTGMVERVTKSDEGTTDVPQSWSRVGDTLLFSVTHPDNTFTLKAVSPSERTVTSVADIRSIRYSPAATFSSDGHWVAYTLGESPEIAAANAQVFVQPFPATGARYLISRGLHPLWSPDARELFYHRLPDTSDHMEGVTVTSRLNQPTFAFSNPVSLPLREMQYSPPGGERNWDMMPDGKRFIGIIDSPSASGVGRGQINIVVNWFEELKQRAPNK